MRSKEQDPEHFKTLIKLALEAGSHCGNLTKEQHTGDFYTAWDAALKASELKLVDLNAGIASVLAVKDENEIVRPLETFFLLFACFSDTGSRCAEIREVRGLYHFQRLEEALCDRA